MDKNINIGTQLHAAHGYRVDGDTPRVRCNDDHDGRW